jgi:hypothetical protein
LPPTTTPWQATNMSMHIAGALGLVLSIMSPSVSALDLLPGHSFAKLLIIPPNVTIMTPREKNPQIEQQLFGSAQHGFSELKSILERQSCQPGWGNCPNDSGCCQIGGRCCGNKKCCRPGYWCYATGCCLLTQNGCDDKVNHQSTQCAFDHS